MFGLTLMRAQKEVVKESSDLELGIWNPIGLGTVAKTILFEWKWVTSFQGNGKSSISIIGKAF